MDASTLPPETGSGLLPESHREPDEAIGLSVAWSRHNPSQVGESLWVPLEDTEGRVFGRGTGDGSARRAELQRWAPAAGTSTHIADCPRISRSQLRLRVVDGSQLLVENIGSGNLELRGTEVDRATLRAGETIVLRNELVFICVRRPRRLRRALATIALPAHEFGQPDALGMIGESAAAWELRESIVAASAVPSHVLVCGASGAGKELVARAVHDLSSRRGRPMISRNAATIPESLADAELFGNTRGYPQAGMPERPGLVGEADGSSLFLDEIGELPHSLQAHLLRVLDEGEYQRLGEARARRANLRLIAATNRQPTELKHDLLARFALRITVPDLNDRREDIPLLIAHLLRRQARHEPSLLTRFFPAGDPSAAPRVSPRLVESLVNHDYKTNVRELLGLLSVATRESGGGYIDSWPTSEGAMRATLPPSRDVPREAWLSVEEGARLALLRKHRFSPTSCGRDSAYPGNRQTADLHFRHLACKALGACGWSVNDAAALLAGADASLIEKCRARVRTFVANLEVRVGAEPKDELNRALIEDWKGLVDAVLPLVEVLRAKTTPFEGQ